MNGFAMTPSHKETLQLAFLFPALFPTLRDGYATDREGCAYNFSSKHSDREGQYIAKKRPSGFVILSGAKDLSPDRDPSLRSELAQDAKRRDDKPEAASFDSQNVFFEM